MAAPRRRPTRTDFVRRRALALGAGLGLLAVVVALARGDGGSPFQTAVDATLTPAQAAQLPWRQRYASGSAGPLDGRGLPAAAAQRAAVKRYFRLGLPIYCAGGRAGYAALTFDDGPSRYSPEVQRLLRRAGVRSTFFLVGQNVAADPEGARRAREMGGAANHTRTHANLEQLAPRELRLELLDTTRALRRATGESPTLMRPPYGARSPRIDRVVHRVGMVPVMWDVDTRDSGGAGSQEIALNFEQNLHPGAIVLMHDTYDRSLAALPSVLAAARRRGIRLVTVPQLLALDPPPESLVRAGPLACSERERFQAQEDATAMRLDG